MNVKSLAIKNYPKYWSKVRLAYLVGIGRLSEKDYAEITGEEYIKQEQS